MKKMTYVFIFDLDDTLYKEIDFVRSAFTHIDRLLVADYGYTAGVGQMTLSGAFIEGLNPISALVARLEEDGIHIPNAVDWLVSEYRYHIPQISLDDDVYDFLCRLDKDDIDMYIITDGRSVTQRNKIRVLGLDEFIPPRNVYISEDVGADKTENKAFSEILESYKTEWMKDLVQFIFVGDNPQKDFFVGNSYGFPTVMLSNDGYNIHSQDLNVPRLYKPKFKVKNFSQLYTLLRKGVFDKILSI